LTIEKLALALDLRPSVLLSRAEDLSQAQLAHGPSN
jgi:hypothetical protein